MTECCKKKKKIIRENAFEQKKEKPELKFNPGLALIGLRTTGSVGTYMAPDGYDQIDGLFATFGFTTVSKGFLKRRSNLSSLPCKV